MLTIHASWISVFIATLIYFPHYYAYFMARARYYLYGEGPEAIADTLAQAYEAWNATSASEAAATAVATAARLVKEL